MSDIDRIAGLRPGMVEALSRLQQEPGALGLERIVSLARLGLTSAERAALLAAAETPALARIPVEGPGGIIPLAAGLAAIAVAQSTDQGLARQVAVLAGIAEPAQQEGLIAALAGMATPAAAQEALALWRRGVRLKPAPWLANPDLARRLYPELFALRPSLAMPAQQEALLDLTLGLVARGVLKQIPAQAAEWLLPAARSRIAAACSTRPCDYAAPDQAEGLTRAAEAADALILAGLATPEDEATWMQQHPRLAALATARRLVLDPERIRAEDRARLPAMLQEAPAVSLLAQQIPPERRGRLEAQGLPMAEMAALARAAEQLRRIQGHWPSTLRQVVVLSQGLLRRRQERVLAFVPRPGQAERAALLGVEGGFAAGTQALASATPRQHAARLRAEAARAAAQSLSAEAQSLPDVFAR